MHDLPPLHTLPAFEAVARLGSFLAAAGRRYLAVVREALLRLDEASAVLRAPRRERLRISAAPALGSKWLVARVAEYQQGHPDLEFTLGTATGLRPLLNGEADIGLRYGEEEWPGLLAWKLFEERVFPVCSPTLAANLQTPTDLDGVRLLRHPLLSWSRWFAAAGLRRPEPASGPTYEDALLMLEAAVAGHGVALMAATLAQPYLDEGRLVRPFAEDCPDRSFYIVAPPAVQEKPAIMDFIRWLLRCTRQNGQKPS